MEPTRVNVEELPKVSWYREWIPIFIAILALVISLISINLTRKDFIRNTRPFAWAINFGILDPQNNRILDQPQTVSFRVDNSPARIILLEVKLATTLEDNENILFYDKLENLVRYPDDKAQWTYVIALNEYNSIIQQLSIDELESLTRIVTLKYEALSGGRKYYSELKQKLNSQRTQWITIYENGN